MIFFLLGFLCKESNIILLAILFLINFLIFEKFNFKKINLKDFSSDSLKLLNGLDIDEAISFYVKTYGYHPTRAKLQLQKKMARKKLKLDGFSVARVIAEYKGAYKVKNPTSEYLAKITGKQMFNASSREDYPAVGDWVIIDPSAGYFASTAAVALRRIVKYCLSAGFCRKCWCASKASD